MEVATATGTHDETRERALDHLWKLVKQEESSGKAKRKDWQTSTRSELVELFIDEGDDAAAWEAFIGGQVSTQLWPQMAVARGKTHPRDAIALYHELLSVAVMQGGTNARYDEAFEVVRAIRRLREGLGEQVQFAAELTAIRSTYRAKRNFIKLLDTLS
jgi:uncharacterized Zn finger protein